MTQRKLSYVSPLALSFHHDLEPRPSTLHRCYMRALLPFCKIVLSDATERVRCCFKDRGETERMVMFDLWRSVRTGIAGARLSSLHHQLNSFCKTHTILQSVRARTEKSCTS